MPEEPEDVIDAAENKETAKYAFLVRKVVSTEDSRKKYTIDSIIVQSPLLKQCLGIALKDYPGVTTNLTRLVFKAPFQPFVHRWLQIEGLLERTEDETTRSHLQILRDVLYAELKDAISAKNDLVKNGVITFEFLWTIFEPGSLVFGTDEGKERVYQLHSSQYTTDLKRGLQYLNLYVWGVDYDGEKFGACYEYLRHYEFEGTKKITNLKVFPLNVHPHRTELIKRLVSRGQLFEKFGGYHFEDYHGVAVGYGPCGLIKHNVNSRIIIDCDAHNRFLPNRAVNFSPLRNVDNKQLGHGILGDEDSDADDEDEEHSYYTEDDESIATPESSDGTKLEHRPLSRKELLMSVPFVRGYAIKPKRWLLFFVDQITPIKFSENAFASLILPAEQKELIRAFVQSQVKYKDTFDDFISGKGRGMILLLSGPPGVGKTLSAESVAEDMKVPLYMMSAGDLGLDPSSIEQSLNIVLEMVAKWNAVLLLDEADVFLEARSSNDLERNKMVSIFLRVLEYYEGILFLTTNRVTNIDDAFHSRIHISLRYPNLGENSRRHIWSTFLGDNKKISGEDLDKLAKVNMNGREIKNMMKTAQMLARNSGDGAVSMENIKTILAIERQKVWTS